MVQAKNIWRDSRNTKSLKEYGQESASHLPLRENCNHQGINGQEIDVIDVITLSNGSIVFKCHFCGQKINVQEK